MSLAIVSWCQLTMFLFASITFPPKNISWQDPGFFFSAAVVRQCTAVVNPLPEKWGVHTRGIQHFGKNYLVFPVYVRIARVCPSCIRVPPKTQDPHHSRISRKFQPQLFKRIRFMYELTNLKLCIIR